MKQTQFRQVLILSAELANENLGTNMIRSGTLRQCLLDVDVIVHAAIGVYKGKPETSFVVFPRNIRELEMVMGFAFDNFGQETVLAQLSDGEAYLYDSNESRVHIGKLRETTKALAVTQDNYTVFNDRYFTTKVA